MTDLSGDSHKPDDANYLVDELTNTSHKKTLSSFLITFFILMAIWILLSGKFDVFHLSLGVMSSALIAFLFSDLLFKNPDLRSLPRVWLRFIAYIPWLIYQIFLANLHVLYLVFHPRMMDLIDPKIIEFRSQLKKEMSLLTFANSITLTPGTITVSATVLGKFAVHAIDETSGRALPGEMEKRVERIFED